MRTPDRLRDAAVVAAMAATLACVAASARAQAPTPESNAQAALPLIAPIPPLPATAPKPPADPRDFEGTWYHHQVLVWRNEQDMYGNDLPFTDRGRRVRDRRVKASYDDQTPYGNASAECLPPGQQWQMDLNFPFQVYQTKDSLSLLFQEYHGSWNIRLNAPPAISKAAPAARSFMGNSVGRWDGDTLVVDSTGYKLPLWLDVDGTPASANAHLQFRIRRIELDAPMLEIVTTVDDPDFYKTPWSIVRLFAWRPDMAVFNEYNCEWQTGAPGGVSRYGLVPEPPEEP